MNGNESSIILRSPIPFVLVGASRDKFENRNNQVLVRSNNADIELVGFVRQTEISSSESESNTSFFESRGFRAITGLGPPPRHESIDRRHSVYVLAWRGKARPGKEIENQFKRSLPDILMGIEHSSELETEWGLAYLIFLIQDNETILQRRQRLMTITLLACVIAIVVAVTVILTIVT